MTNLLHCEVEKGSCRVDEAHGDGVAHKLEGVGEELLGPLNALLEQSALAPGQRVQRGHEVRFARFARLLQTTISQKWARKINRRTVDSSSATMAKMTSAAE
jgi:hypothetical protein